MLLLGYGYKRNNLARLGGYPAHQNVADMSDFFYFDFVFIWLRRGVGGDGGGTGGEGAGDGLTEI